MENAFLSSKSLICGKTIPIVIPEEEVQDIDMMEDWHFAELKYEYLIKSGKL